MSDERVAPDATADDGSAPVRVFMSYRRADDHHFIGRLHDRLCSAFGDDMVFRDIDSIPAGTNFRSVILRTLNEVDAVVAVIGPRWARQGHDIETDYVYLELAEALKQSKPTIPVLMEETSMPASDALPVELRSLTQIQAIAVHGDPAFRRDSSRLVDVIRHAVTTDRARVAQERRAAEEQAARVEAERSERERLAEQLRAEERAARLRLAELEEAAARRQIELESARLADISDKLRLAEAAHGVAAVIDPPTEKQIAPPTEEQIAPPTEEQIAPPAEEQIAPPAEMEIDPPAEEQIDPAAEEAVAAATEEEFTPAPVAVLESPAVVEPAESVPSTRGRWVAGPRPLQALIVAATVLGVIALFENRSVETPFSELSQDWRVDLCVWILTLAVAIPLFLGDRPIDQRFVLIGVSVSAFFFEFLQAAAFVRYGTTRFDEGSWFILKVLQTVCLLGAIWLVRDRPSGSLPSSPRVRIALVAMATVCGALLVAATRDQWSGAGDLVESGFLKDRTPFVVWLIFLVLGPVGVTIGLSTRRSYGSRVSLATIATLAPFGYLAEAIFVDQVLSLDATLWVWTAVAHVPLAVVAWWTVAAAARRGDLARSVDAA